MVGRGAVRHGAPLCREREVEQNWTSGTSVAAVAAVEVQGTLYHRAAGVSGTAVGKEPAGNRNAVGDVVTQGKGFLQGPKRSGVAGLKRDGLVAEETSGVVVARKLLGSRRVGVVWRLVKRAAWLSKVLAIC